MNEEDVGILHALMRDLKESINNLQIKVDKTESRLKNLEEKNDKK